MSIPLDHLYHYIESVAQDVYGDTVIYRFYPHGSKNIDDLGTLRSYDSPVPYAINLPIYCYDQEPLNFDLYKNERLIVSYDPGLYNFAHKQVDFYKNFMRDGNIYDRAILIHSEKNSPEVKKYTDSNLCVSVYYWCHAIIARDWFRYAQHVDLTTSTVDKRFLIYNRAWSGTREYRLKFADLLVDYNLLHDTKTSIAFNCDNQYYKDYSLSNPQFKVNNNLENFFLENTVPPTFSAEFDSNDYLTTGIEVVLETLFDDSRHHLTEKTLRPIACGKPFLLASTPGSLQYLRDYGFKTYGEFFDESYDQIVDPLERLHAICQTMKHIQSWDQPTFNKNIEEMQSIADYNKELFFSDKFETKILDELKTNLKNGIELIENTNQSYEWISRAKVLLKYQPFKDLLFSGKLYSVEQQMTRQTIVKILTKARLYYNRYYNK